MEETLEQQVARLSKELADAQKKNADTSAELDKATKAALELQVKTLTATIEKLNTQIEAEQTLDTNVQTNNIVKPEPQKTVVELEEDYQFDDDPKTTSARVEAWMKEAFKGKSFKEVQDIINQRASESLTESIPQVSNEFLTQLAGVMSRQITTDLVRVKLKIADWFLKPENRIGEFIQVRQPLLGTETEYSKYLDVNDHQIAKTVTQVIMTIGRKQFEISLSREIVTNAFLGIQQMNNFIEQFMGTMYKAFELWLSYTTLSALSWFPIVYKIASTVTGDAFVKKAINLIKKMQMPSERFNEQGIPTKLEKNNTYVVINANDSTDVDFTLAGIFNFKDIKGQNIVKDAEVQDFLEDFTRMVIFSKNAIMIEPRIDVNGNQTWVKPMITDYVKNFWYRMARMKWEIAVHIVNEKFTPVAGDQLKFVNSSTPNMPFASPFDVYDENGTLILADNPIVQDVTQFVEGGQYQAPTRQIDIRGYFRNNYDLGAIPFASPVTAQNVLEVLYKKFPTMDITYDGTTYTPNWFSVTNVTDSSALISVDPNAQKGYVINSFINNFTITYTRVNPPAEEDTESSIAKKVAYITNKHVNKMDVRYTGKKPNIIKRMIDKVNK